MVLRRWVGTTQHATSLNTTTMPRFSEMSRALEIIPLDQLPLLKEGDDLAGIIVSRAKKIGVGIRNRDLVVIGQKAVSKAEGRIIVSEGGKDRGEDRKDRRVRRNCFERIFESAQSRQGRIYREDEARSDLPERRRGQI